MSKRIVFLSALDFKEKSIQVIRKTPEAYVEAGWDVHYIVARDMVRGGNYAYEPEINPAGVRVQRFAWPLTRLRDPTRGRWTLYILTRLASLFVILRLAFEGARLLRQSSADVLYGYEVQGVLAARLLRLLGVVGDAKVVHRFQGTCYVTEMLEQNQKLRQWANIDHLTALRANCDLLIMTNDGTRGDRTLERLKSRALSLHKFWVNGTDSPAGVKDVAAMRESLAIPRGSIVLLSVSRLLAWKRIDRGLAIAAELKRYGLDFIYVIVGEGSERKALERHAVQLGIDDRVRFAGAVPQAEVFSYLNAADFFLSTYDMSNVGNPLLEAIRMEKIIITIDNGDTGDWIKHRHNGLIYKVAPDLAELAAQDIMEIMVNPSLAERIKKGVHELSRDNLWTWRERMRAELTEVETLLEK